MKAILFILVALLIVTSVSYGQFTMRAQAGRCLTAGTAMVAKAYTAATDDTTQSFNVSQWANTVGVLWVKDSASVKVYYQASYDGINFGASNLIDSLSNADNGGAVLGFPLPKGLDAANSVRFEVVFNSFRLGTTSATYYFKVVQKKY